MKKTKKRRKETADTPMFQIKTTLDFGEEGLPLERLGDMTKALKERHLDFVSTVTWRIRAYRVRPLCGSPRVRRFAVGRRIAP